MKFRIIDSEDRKKNLNNRSIHEAKPVFTLECAKQSNQNCNNLDVLLLNPGPGLEI